QEGDRSRNANDYLTHVHLQRLRGRRRGYKRGGKPARFFAANGSSLISTTLAARRWPKTLHRREGAGPNQEGGLLSWLAALTCLSHRCSERESPAGEPGFQPYSCGAWRWGCRGIREAIPTAYERAKSNI